MHVDWIRMFAPDTPMLEIVVRGTVVYLVLFLLLRITHRRQSGTLGITNLLAIVLIADAAQNAMSANYHSIAEGLFLVATIVFWAWFLDWLGYRLPALQRLVHPRPLLLVRDGRVLRRGLKEELITEEELMSHLREQGVEHIRDVKRAFIEGDGRISVIKKDGESGGKHDDRRIA